MAKYPRRNTEYHAILEEAEQEAELDCGCLIREGEDGATMEFWVCMLHETAQRMLDALELIAQAAYVGRAGDAIQCIFCEQVQVHEEECVMHLVHEVTRSDNWNAASAGCLATSSSQVSQSLSSSVSDIYPEPSSKKSRGSASSPPPVWESTCRGPLSSCLALVARSTCHARFPPC
jgi:hypothetical protein